MGINGTFLFIERGSLSALDVTTALGELTAAPVVSREELTAEMWNLDRRLLGFAVIPGEHWFVVAATDRSVDHIEPQALARRLATPVVVTTLVEICDPPAPEQVVVYGENVEDRFHGLCYAVPGLRYAHGAQCEGVAYVTVRTEDERDHEQRWRVEPSTNESEPEIPF